MIAGVGFFWCPLVAIIMVFDRYVHLFIFFRRYGSRVAMRTLKGATFAVDLNGIFGTTPKCDWG